MVMYIIANVFFYLIWKEMVRKRYIIGKVSCPKILKNVIPSRISAEGNFITKRKKNVISLSYEEKECIEKVLLVLV